MRVVLTGKIVGYNHILTLLGTDVLDDGLCPLRNSVLGQLSGQPEVDGSLDLLRGDGRPLGLVSKTRCLPSSVLKDVIDKQFYAAQGFRGDASVRVDGVTLHTDGITHPLKKTTTLVETRKGEQR